MRRRVFAIVIAILAISVIEVRGQGDDPETLVVTPVNMRGWTTADTRPGGAVNFVLDSTPPAGSGALELATDATTAAKAQLLHPTLTPLAQVEDLSFYAKLVSGPPHASASYQLATCLDGVDSNGVCIGFTTFVYEPYENGVVIPNTWQEWDADAGQWWSSRTYTNGSCAVVAGAGGAPFYNLGTMATLCPNAVVMGFGVNVGTFNPGYDIYVDLVKFNNTTYDFEVFSTPASADECKKGGWSTFNPPTGPYKNQGQCVSSTVP
jgi:hypothetical protein